MIVVTHRPQILMLVDRIIVMEQGQIVMDGPKQAVLDRLSGRPTTPSVAVAGNQPPATDTANRKPSKGPAAWHFTKNKNCRKKT